MGIFFRTFYTFLRVFFYFANESFNVCAYFWKCWSPRRRLTTTGYETCFGVQFGTSLFRDYSSAEVKGFQIRCTHTHRNALQHFSSNLIKNLRVTNSQFKRFQIICMILFRFLIKMIDFYKRREEEEERPYIFCYNLCKSKQIN